MSPRKKSAYEAENDNLKAEIRRLNKSHAEQLAAKNAAIEELRDQRPAELATLMGQFRYLRDLLRLLNRIAFLADPLTSIPYDRDKVTTMDNKAEHPMEGQGTKRDRERLQKVSDWVQELVLKIEREIRPKGQPSEVNTTGGPQCWHRDCVARGWKQSWGQEACRECERPFSTYEPLRLVSNGD